MFPPFQIHHTAILVKDIDSAVEHYLTALPYEELPRETISTFGANVAFLVPKGTHAEHTAIEIISPIDDSGTLAKAVLKRGEGLHHVCYSVTDIHAEQQRLTALGFHFIDKEPRDGAHNSLVSFIHPKSCFGVLTELRQQK